MDSTSLPSTSGRIHHKADEELEGFDDFTIASSWEKVIAAVEMTAREWQAAGSAGLLEYVLRDLKRSAGRVAHFDCPWVDQPGEDGAGAVPVVGSRSLHRVHKEISFEDKPYVIIFFFHVGSEDETRDEWPIGLHHLQLWFDVRDFLVIVPITHSGVIYDTRVATMLLSTVAIALSSCGSDWPAFFPVHDSTRKAYRGVQGTNSSYSITFEADRIASWVPVRFMHLEGLYELFVSKVAFTASTSAAVPALKVEFTMRLTYRTRMHGLEHQTRSRAAPIPEARPDYGDEAPIEPSWDEDLPWGEWHSVQDPIKGFELVTIWNSRFVSSPGDMAEYENVSTFDADSWTLIPVFEEKMAESQFEEEFAGRLEELVRAFYVAGEAQFMDDFSNVLKPEMDLLLEGFTVPPPSVLERVLKDLFYSDTIPSGDGLSYRNYGTCIKAAPPESLFGRLSLQALRFGTCNIRAISELWLEFVREVRWCWDECQPLPRVLAEEQVDFDTCILTQKLQLLAACISFKAEDVRERQSASVPQKSQGVDAKVDRRRTREFNINKNIDVPAKTRPASHRTRTTVSVSLDDFNSGEAYHETMPSFPCESSEEEIESLFIPPHPVSQTANNKEHSLSESSQIRQIRHSSEDVEQVEFHQSDNTRKHDRNTGSRKGSTGPFKDLLLLKVKEAVHAPLLQRMPVMTQDMLVEREQAIAALSKSPSEKVARVRLQTDVLASDMAAFKAANPEAVFEDFVRWHSPHDWLPEGAMESERTSSTRPTKNESNWPPKGKLSRRMLEPRNIWAQIWEHVTPEPASEQKPLFDYKREGEKVLHYLDTLRPQQLLGQMVCTAFMASLDALRRTDVGEMGRLEQEFEEFCSTMSFLENLVKLERADIPSKGEIDSWREDLLRLCSGLGKLERDVFVAASLYQKLKATPNLMSALFKSFLEDGERLTNARVHSFGHYSFQGSTNHAVSERERVAELFSTSTNSRPAGTSQRMGNFLHGLEPDAREVKFQCYEEDLRKRWNSRKERKFRSTTFSHRMYVCGTSTDLQVALSVVSRD